MEHYWEMLDLNPGDNQGIRYQLLLNLLTIWRHEEAEALLDRYPDDVGASWLYSRTLLLFRKEKRSRAARGALREALKANENIAYFLLGLDDAPDEEEEAGHAGYIAVGGPSEAREYVMEATPAWTSTPGALVWLLEILSK